jgi:uncharacterized protein (TIGR02679 family)
MTRHLPERLASPHLAPVWKRAWKAMARAGPADWPTVQISVPLEDDESRLAMSSLLGRPVAPGTATVGVRLDRLDEIVRRPGDGWDLEAVVSAVAGPVPDRRATQQAEDDAVARAIDDARRRGPGDDWFTTWLDELAGDGTLVRLHRRGEVHGIVAAAATLDALPADGVPLPVLASRITGDTKALSGGTLAGLVLRALSALLGEARPTNAAARRSLWEAVGVVPDDLASQVLVLNLTLGGTVLGGWLREAAAEGLAFRATLQQLNRSPVTVVEPAAVFVCENPAVLRAAAERFGGSARPMVCTEGRPSVACARMLDLLAGGGCELRYHGDFDWPGLRIAADVLLRPSARPWRFGADDYRSAANSPTGWADRSPLEGSPATSPWDPDLATAMTELGKAVYEEDVLDLLLGDVGR